jgi:gamma-glutamyltranspeptidase/glutathione hydrolase
MTIANPHVGPKASTHPIETWQVCKPAVTGARGVVASQNVDAAMAGASVLEAGGNAIDAAVATALALTVAEPWMSGLGGGGYAIVREGKTGTVKVVDFGMIAAKGLDPADYPVDEGREAADWFGFPAVVEDRNQHGYGSIAVPGSCAGYALLAETYGSKSWAELLAPARAMARSGHRVSWWSTVQVAAEAAWLRTYPGSSSVWLPDGLPPSASDAGPSYLDMGGFARTLDRLAEAGPRDFYEGEIAQRLLADLQAGGSKISAEDLAGYRARIVDPITKQRGDAEYHLLPGYTAGPTFAHALDLLPESFGEAMPGPETFAAYARALTESYRVRFETMGHAGDMGDRSCTTHLSTLDADGNMVVMTTTLLSRFGSRVVLPDTGLLMNNGINWFDPRQGRPNSIKGGVRPLSNMSPMMATRAGAPWFGFGASGGRKIMPAIFQLASFANDFGMDLEAALLHPRIETSLVDTLGADDRLSAAVFEALGAVAPTGPIEATSFPARFAIPNGVAMSEHGCAGAAHPFGPLNAALGV